MHLDRLAVRCDTVSPPELDLASPLQDFIWNRHDSGLPPRHAPTETVSKLSHILHTLFKLFLLSLAPPLL